MTTKTSLLTADRLRQVLDYDPQTGIFTWKHRTENGWNRAFTGKVAGTVNQDGYIQMKVDTVIYLAHRLAWMHVYGGMPYEIDHRDGNVRNNALNNLRLCDDTLNQQNQKIIKDTQSGYACVSKSGRKWRARTEQGGKKFNLGTFWAKEDAIAAVHEWKMVNYPFYTARP